MATAIEKEEKGLYYLITVDGDFSVKSLRFIRQAAEEAMTIGHVSMAFNLTKTSYIDSSGIGLLANIHKKLITKGGSVHLVGVSLDIQDAMEVSGLMQMIPHYKTTDEADAQIG